MKRWFVLTLRVALLLAILAGFGWYLTRHPELAGTIVSTPKWIIGVLVALYVLWFYTLTGSVHAQFQLSGHRIPMKELFLLNAYSTLANFFVPGQGGVALRGAYMKKKHGMLVRAYSTATVLYYLCFAIISALLLLHTILTWMVAIVLFFVAFGLLGLLVIIAARQFGRWTFGVQGIHTRGFASLVAWTLANCIVQVAIYFTELKVVLPSIHLTQGITYTGAANFAQFVALTPGAIGIRESFLIFSEQLHGVSTPFVLAASVVDRASFLVFLGALFLGCLSMHARDRLDIKKLETPT